MKTGRKKNVTLIVLVVVILVGLFISVSTVSHCGISLYTEVANWKVGDSNLPSRILWQHAEQNVSSHSAETIPTNGLALSGQHVVYWRIPHFSLCDLSPTVTAYDVHTGANAWRYVPRNQLEQDLAQIPNGYLVIVDGWLTKLNNLGGTIWQTHDLPSRAARQAYQYSDAIYVPSFSKIYVFDPLSGKIRTTIESPYVVDYWGDYYLSIKQDASLALFQVGNDTEIATLGTSGKRSAMNYISALGKFTYRFGDVVIVYPDTASTRFQVFRLIDGQLLWEHSGGFRSWPIVFNGWLALYGQTGIRFFDLTTGEPRGQILLTRIARERIAPKPDALQLVWIASYDNMIAVYYRDTAELMVIQVHLPATEHKQ